MATALAAYMAIVNRRRTELLYGNRPHGAPTIPANARTLSDGSVRTTSDLTNRTTS